MFYKLPWLYHETVDCDVATAELEDTVWTFCFFPN